MFYCVTLISFFSYFCNQLHASPLYKPPLILAIGEQRAITVKNLKKYSLSGEAVRISPSGKLLISSEKNEEILLIKAVAVGKSHLWILNHNHTSEQRIIEVRKTLSFDLPASLLNSLSELQETEVFITGKAVFLEGHIYHEHDAKKIAALAESYPQIIRNRTQIDISLLQTKQKELNQWLENSPYDKHLKIVLENDTLIVQGTLKNLSEKSMATQLVVRIWPLISLKVEAPPDDAPTVFFRIFLIEMNRSHLNDFGFQWSHSQEGVLVAKIPFSQNVTFSDLQVALHALEKKGNAKILSAPEIAIRAPGKAELFSGGRLPISTHTRFFANVQWQKFGTTLKLSITHLTQNSVRLEVFGESSELDRSISHSDIPGIRTNQIQTQVDAEIQKPLAICGLSKEVNHHLNTGVPFLSQIPIISLFFKLGNFIQTYSEFFVILYPQLDVPTVSLPEKPQEKSNK